MAVTVTAGGYIKRTPLTEYRAQRRGGKGTQGMATKDEDFVTTLFVANTHTQLLFFSTDGMVYKLKCWRLPQGGRNARGKAIVNILPIAPGMGIAAIMPVDKPERNGRACRSCSPPPTATCAATRSTTSPTSSRTARSR
jgi:DNA gyrase subunit A